MSHQCTNVAVVYSTNRKELEAVVNEVKNTFECYTDIEMDDNQCEFEFSSSYSFPKEAFEAITQKYPGNSLYIQIVTYELPDEYVAHHIYKNGCWTDKLKRESDKNN